MLIVSLSSIPPRFHLLGPTLRSILAQNVRIDAIEVQICKSYRRFPELDFSMPDVPDGVTVKLVDLDYGPATKVLPAAREYRGQDVDILFCDDDRICSVGWAGKFLEASKQKPGVAIANSGWDLDKLGLDYSKNKRQPRAIRLNSRLDMIYRARRIWQKVLELAEGRKRYKPSRHMSFFREGYIDILEGCGGVLIKPDMFDDEAYVIPDKLWTVDDIWLSGMLARRDIGIWSNKYGSIPEEQQGSTDALSSSVIEGLDRTQANLACAEYLRDTYNIWQN